MTGIDWELQQLKLALSLSISTMKFPQFFPWSGHIFGEKNCSTYIFAFEFVSYEIPMQVYSSPSLEKLWKIAAM